MKVGLVQLTSSDDPVENLAVAGDLIRQAATKGATFVATPEVTNCVSLSRARQHDVLATEDADKTLSGLKTLAADLGIWCLIGSLALKTDGAKFVNRSMLIAPDGGVAARYDKIHMFDVALASGETYRESDGYQAGTAAVIADLDTVRVGMTICYDVRFPGLYRHLAQAGAEIIAIPSAFTVPTGSAHWETLLRARAIETGAWIIAPAQTGQHGAVAGKQRETYGHAMIVDPWGEVVVDMGTEPGVHVADLDMSRVAEARGRIPSLCHDRTYRGADG